MTLFEYIDILLNEMESGIGINVMGYLPTTVAGVIRPRMAYLHDNKLSDNYSKIKKKKTKNQKLTSPMEL